MCALELRQIVSLADSNANNLKTITRQWDEFGRPRSVSFVIKSWMVLLTTPLRQGAHYFSRALRRWQWKNPNKKAHFAANKRAQRLDERRWVPATHYNKEAAKPFGTETVCAKCFHDSIQFGGAWTHESVSASQFCTWKSRSARRDDQPRRVGPLCCWCQ